eukprot:m.18977 g.18977  ORF g.18977 m.18977 type:complete len:464 (+) comp5046_c0_seq1:336-1727(+)
MSFRVRQSKFRHVFGKAAKREDSYDGVRVSKNAWDSPFCSVNARFIAIVLESGGGGAFTVLNLENTGRVDINQPKICGHTGNVLDIKFCPYNDFVIASCSEDCTVKVWEIPEGGLSENIETPVVDLVGHQRRVGAVEWHPTAENILFSAGFDYMVFGWNIGTGEIVTTIDCHTDTIHCLAFNWNGSLLATSSKDKKLRIIDPRSGVVQQEGKVHDGSKGIRCTWLGTTGRILTTGFSRMNDRQYAIWDPEDLTKPLKQEKLDQSSGVIFPYYDEDTKMFFLAGKGDGNIRYYELADASPYCFYINDYKTAVPQRGVAMMPKRAVSVGECEVARLYKLTPKGFVEVVSFTVPRKSTLFQEDLFPPTKKDVACLSAQDWLAGQDAEPEYISLKDGYEPPARAKLEVEEKVKKQAEEKDAIDAPPKGEKDLLKAWHTQKEEIKRLTEQLATANITIRTLETKLGDN